MTDSYTELGRLRGELIEAAAKGNAIVLRVYQLLGELSAINVDMAIKLAQLPQPRPYPAKPQPTPPSRPKSRSKKSGGNSKPSTSALLARHGDKDVFTQPEAAELLGLKPQTLKAYRVRGDGPKEIPVEGGKYPYSYRKEDLVEWTQGRRGKLGKRFAEE